MKEELVAAIKNALGRGQTVEQAIASLINAGYQPNDVREAAGTFSGATNIISQQTKPIEVKNQASPTPEGNPIPEVNRAQSVQATPQRNTPIYPQKKSSHGLIIFLVVLLLLLVAALVVSVIFKDKILEFVNNLSFVKNFSP